MRLLPLHTVQWYEFICCNISYEFMILSIRWMHAPSREHCEVGLSTQWIESIVSKMKIHCRFWIWIRESWNAWKCSCADSIPSFRIHRDFKWRALWHWETKSQSQRKEKKNKHATEHMKQWRVVRISASWKVLSTFRMAHNLYYKIIRTEHNVSGTLMGTLFKSKWIAYTLTHSQAFLLLRLLLFAILIHRSPVHYHKG